jgi:Tol biopolymer transport system component
LLLFGLLSGCAARSADIITYDSASLSNVIRVTDNHFRKDAVRISPDGAKILYCEANIMNVDAYISFDQFSVMLLRDANLPSKTPIVTDPSFGPAWYDDSAGFVYVVYEGGSSKLVKSNITGGGKTYITRNSIGDFDRRPSIKGHDILCETSINEVSHIVRLKDDGSEVTILGEGNSPSWHPKENKSVFIKDGSVSEMTLQNNQVTQIYSAMTDKNRRQFKFEVRKRCSEKTSLGVRYPKALPGRLLILSTIRSRCLWVSLSNDIPLGRYCRISPLVCSFNPRSHEWQGWAK